MWGFFYSLGKDILGVFTRLFSGRQRINSLEKENLELKQKISTVKNEKLELQKEIDALKKDQLKNPLKRHNSLPCYVDESDKLICSNCYEAEDKRISLIPSGNPIAFWQCPKCKLYIEHPQRNFPTQANNDWNPFDN